MNSLFNSQVFGDFAKSFFDFAIKPAFRFSAPVFVFYMVTLLVFAFTVNCFAIAWICGKSKIFNDLHILVFNLLAVNTLQAAFYMPLTTLVILSKDWIFGKVLCFSYPLLRVTFKLNGSKNVSII